MNGDLWVALLAAAVLALLAAVIVSTPERRMFSNAVRTK